MQNFRIGKYIVQGVIGNGGGNTIYKAYDTDMNLDVVLKKLNPELRGLLDDRTELNVLKNLKHPCLPRLLNFFELNGDMYTVIDYIPGHSFKEYLDSGTVFQEKSVITWAKQICNTLHYLHTRPRPIIHSDLKPGNIMLMPDGNICLIDFNISFSLNGDSSWALGYSSDYAAPEQIQAIRNNQREYDIRKWKNIDARADIYSFGATLYHILSRRKPMLQKDGYITDILEICPTINPVLASIVMKCLEPEPADRYQNVKELLTDLNNIDKNDHRYRSLLLRQRILYVSCGVLFVVFAFFAVYGYFRMDEDKALRYESLVRQEADCVSRGDYENMEIFFQRAVSTDAKQLDAYLQKAAGLNKQRKYGDNIDFISRQILSNSKINASSMELADVYYLLGSSYEQMGDYTNAAAWYKKALDSGSGDVEYYRDYAIALAESGNPEDAKAVIEAAKENNLETIQLSYAEGEICFYSGDYVQAETIFRQCLDTSVDDDLRLRAYQMEGKCMVAQDNSADGLSRKAQLLEEARTEFPEERIYPILQDLANTYGLLGNKTGDTASFQKAIQIYEQIRSQETGSYETDYALSVLYQNIQDYSHAEEILKQMLNDYGENYRTYKALAFLDFYRQAQKAEGQRSYSSFEAYYLKADELYQVRPENYAEDQEMAQLADAYNQLKAGGWIG